MWNKKRSVILSIIICFVFLAVLTAFVFLGPWFVKMWLTEYRGWMDDSVYLYDMIILFALAFYPGSVFAYITLYSLIRLLFNIKNEQIFINTNVKYLRRISWSCIAVFIITLISGFFYIPYFFIAVAAGFVGLMLRIVKNAFQSAVALREENDLTI
ncbi:MAG: DUF2975 domain-containing protein [Ruminococcaceae bacterium]|nr:DUF2975 domain-containing protein [Oscillospiraceae bacterium]